MQRDNGAISLILLAVMLLISVLIISDRALSYSHHTAAAVHLGEGQAPQD
jgi:hypothetical protein